MGYKISYAGLPRAERYQRALHDAKDYLSPTQWGAVIKLGVDTKMNPQLSAKRKVLRMRLMLAFAGLQGPPATAVIKYAWGLMRYVHRQEG